MRKLLVIIAMCLSMISFAASKDIRTVTFSTKLHCENCVKKVVENVSYLKGVKDLDVSLEKQEIKVSYDAAKTDVPTIVKEINRLGYPAEQKKAPQPEKK